MRYQKDAHRYRAMIRKKQRIQRAKGISLVALAIAMMLYAVPCFATSIWDNNGKSSTVSNIAFTNEINDFGVAESAAVPDRSTEPNAQAEPTASAPIVYDFSGYLVGETMGPGVISDDEAVSSAVKRAQAASIAKAESASKLGPIYKDLVKPDGSLGNLSYACIAFFISIICAVIGTRSLVSSRNMRVRELIASYDSALRAS